ncbi:hypothetical protein HPB50_010788 [Hyalomma asiaticum]|uniref:Uncharacterized protein n=1 Tax=Hyalomma asiaticum TaxID=266040 RepID=A0ACB7RI52_HYAAI|nr:hypothetical protein HPB50_010788 [Hyalomma asiaticum]
MVARFSDATTVFQAQPRCNLLGSLLENAISSRLAKGDPHTPELLATPSPEGREEVLPSTSLSVQLQATQRAEEVATRLDLEGQLPP